MPSRPVARAACSATLHPVLAQRVGTRPFGRLAIGLALHARFKRACAAERRKHRIGSRRIVARRDHVPDAQRVGLIFLLARELQDVEQRARARRIGSPPKIAPIACPIQASGLRLTYSSRAWGVVRGDMADLMAERESELRFIVHQTRAAAE